ncbi:DIP1984 family protein [Rhodococcus yunnanensis]|nr:DIP1984 family protein [Rhodococcus yunnanensis]MCZ4278372.1 DIP1984 family protein [Rhodococcus yunnanensis]
MKLAEALAERAELVRRAEHLKVRILANARHQDGESPAENASELLSEHGATLDRLQVLIRRINRTNSAAMVRDGTVTDALASRDVLRMKHKAVTAAADAASGREHDHRYGPGSYARSWFILQHCQSRSSAPPPMTSPSRSARSTSRSNASTGSTT